MPLPKHSIKDHGASRASRILVENPMLKLKQQTALVKARIEHDYLQLKADLSHGNPHVVELRELLHYLTDTIKDTPFDSMIKQFPPMVSQEVADNIKPYADDFYGDLWVCIDAFNSSLKEFVRECLKSLNQEYGEYVKTLPPLDKDTEVLSLINKISEIANVEHEFSEFWHRLLVAHKKLKQLIFKDEGHSRPTLLEDYLQEVLVTADVPIPTEKKHLGLRSFTKPRTQVTRGAARPLSKPPTKAMPKRPTRSKAARPTTGRASSAKPPLVRQGTYDVIKSGGQRPIMEESFGNVSRLIEFFTPGETSRVYSDMGSDSEHYFSASETSYRTPKSSATMRTKSPSRTAPAKSSRRSRSVTTKNRERFGAESRQWQFEKRGELFGSTRSKIPRRDKSIGTLPPRVHMTAPITSRGSLIPISTSRSRSRSPSSHTRSRRSSRSRSPAKSMKDRSRK